jgi:excisionase family DNA binding protein
MLEYPSKTTQYMTTEEVADQLRVHWQTVLDLIRSGMLTAIKVGKSYRISPEDLESFINEHSSNGIYRYKQQFEDRAKDLGKINQFLQTRLLIISCGFIGVDSIESLFKNRQEGVGKIISDNSRLRPHGWHIDPTLGGYPKPVAGNFLEYLDKVRCLRVYKDGHVLAAATLGNNFLGWGVNDLESDNPDKAVNSLAVAEFITNVCIKASLIAKEMRPKPTKVFITGCIFNPRVNKVDLLHAGWPTFMSPDQIGDSFQSKEHWFDTKIMPASGVDEAPKSAAFLWKEFCRAFGMYDSDVPILTQDGQKIDVESILERG